MGADLESEEPHQTNWWGRKAGLREVLKLALPLVISAMSWTVMTFVDRVFLKWDSGEAMAAAFSASALWFCLLCLPLGICMYCATFVSQYFGNHQYERIGPAAWQGVWVTLLLTPFMLLAIPLAPTLFALANHEPAVQSLEILYFQVLCWGSPAMLIGQALSSFYAGRGETRVVMIVDSLAAILNLFLDYLWIFGEGGFPAMGIAGAGWATVTSLWIKAGVYFLLLSRRSQRERYGSLNFGWDKNLFRRLIYYGAPSGFQLLLDVTGFTVFIILVGRLGSIEAEATSMAFSISTLSFMPIWGFAQATSILVGQYLGENRDDLSSRGTWTSLQIALTYMSVVSILYLFVPQLFLAPFFASSTSSEKELEIWHLSISLLRFVAAYNLLDATMMIFVSAIKGAGDTPFVLLISSIMATSMVLCSWLAVEVFEVGVLGCWMLLTVWIWILGGIYLARFLSGKWRSMRVIEQQPIVAAGST